MNIYDLVDDMNDRMERFINKNTKQIRAEDAGLDNRCGYIYITDDSIIVDKRNDRLIQYYGGFEYVEKDHRKEMGDFVFYSRESSRVADHIDRYFGKDDWLEEDEDAA